MQKDKRNEFFIKVIKGEKFWSLDDKFQPFYHPFGISDGNYAYTFTRVGNCFPSRREARIASRAITRMLKKSALTVSEAE